MNGGYVLFDASAIDVTDATKQSIDLHTRLTECVKSGKPIIMCNYGGATPFTPIVTASSGDYVISFTIGAEVTTILVEDDGVTISKIDVTPDGE